MAKILIPTPLRQFAGKQDSVVLAGATVGEVLQALTTQYGELRRHLYNDEGPGALTYKMTGGSAPLLRRRKSNGSSTSPRTPNRSSTDSPATSGLSRSSAPTC